MIWTKAVGPTALSSTTEVKVGGANLKLPVPQSGRKLYIAGIIPHAAAAAGPTAAEPTAVKVKLLMDSAAIQPYEVLCQPIGASLAKSGIQPLNPAPFYPVNAEVPGGSELQVYGVGLFNHTIEPYVSVTIVLCDYKPGPQVFAKVGTFTNTGTAAAEVKGSGLRLEGGQAIRLITAFMVGTTPATLKGIVGKFRLSSSGLRGMGDLECSAEPVPGVIATDATTPSIQESARLTIVPVDAQITDPCDIDDYFNNAVAVTTTGNWVVGLLFV